MPLGKSWPTSNEGGSSGQHDLKRAKKKNGEPRFERKLPDARRKALIEATIECLKRYGHDGLSIRRISAQAKVSIGLINHHFPTKDALVAEAYRYFNSELVGSLRQAVNEAAGAPREQLSAFFKASFSPPNLDSDVLAVWVVFWGMYRHSKDIQRVQSETYHGYVDLLRGMLADLERESGELRFNLRLAAIGLTALIDGLWLEWCLDPDNFEPREAVQLCEAWVESLEGRIEIA
jgi:TetR/AcrR family transcriptional regulator, transcriptional repressor of bet genes